MKGRQHVQISVLSGLILTSGFLLSDPMISLLFLAGLFLGSLLPDSDASDRMAKHKESVLFAFDTINELVIYPLLLKIFNEKKRHRGILHTIAGVSIFSILLTALIGLTFYFISISLNFLIIGVGLFTGGVLHLMEDSCTISGVNPFYPKFKQYVFNGKISTNNMREKRPDSYSQYLGILFVTLVIISVHYEEPVIITTIISIIALVISWIFFFIICGVKKTYFK